MMFFNVKGVEIPTKPTPTVTRSRTNADQRSAGGARRAWGGRACLSDLKAEEIEESDLIEGATMITRPSLFENIGSDAAVFTY